MRTRFDNLIDFWLKTLIEDPIFKATLVFGFSPKEARESLINQKISEVDNVKKFKTKCVNFFKNTKFEFGDYKSTNEYIEEHNGTNFPYRIYTGLKSSVISQEIEFFLNSLDKKIETLNENLDHFEKANPRIILTKSNYKAPFYFAKMVCIGLNVFSENDDELLSFKKFIENSDELKLQLEKKNYNPAVINSIISKTGSENLINEWRNQKRQSMKKTMLAHIKGKHTDSFDSCSKEAQEIEEIIQQESDLFLQRFKALKE